MTDVSEFFDKLVAELKAHPPVLAEGKVTEDAMGDWLGARFTLDELELFRKFEDLRGPDDADLLVTLAFTTAGLPAPVKK